MEVASVGSQESVRFGKENNPETEEVQNAVAHNREDLDQTCEEEQVYHDASPDGGELHGGFGSASLRECLERVSTTSATCHSGEGMGASSSHTTNPPQVMKPNMEQNHPQESTSAHDLPPEDDSFRPKKRERKEEDLTPKSEQEQLDVKEEPREDFPPTRSSDPMHNTIWLESDTSKGPLDMGHERTKVRLT